MAVTTVGLVVKVNTEDFNEASVLSSVDRQGHCGSGSIETSSDNLVLGNGGHTSCFHVNSERQNWRRTPLTVNNFSESHVGDCVLASQVLEILGQKCRLGISGRSFELRASSSESSGLTTRVRNTNNGNGILGISSQISDVDFWEESGVWSGNSSRVRCDSDDPMITFVGGIGPSNTQIIDMVGFVRTERTSIELIGEIDWGSRSWWGRGRS